MSFDLISLVGLAAVVVMLVNLVMAIVLKSQLSGGMVGKRWNILIVLVLMFMGGYLILPFLSKMPIETLRAIVSFIFLGGAIYVLITIRLIYGIIRELSS
jgi:hypothetical protein